MIRCQSACVVHGHLVAGLWEVDSVAGALVLDIHTGERRVVVCVGGVVRCAEERSEYMVEKHDSNACVGVNFAVLIVMLLYSILWRLTL